MPFFLLKMKIAIFILEYICTMKKILFFISVFLFVIRLSGQESISKDIDSLYREDQFYIGFTYNLLGNKPKNLSQTGFSSGFHMGFIRDMPINKNRNIAIGLGLGYSTKSFNQNLLISRDDLGIVSYSISVDNSTYSKNKFSTHFIEFPLEFRWRTSTISDYNFWRIYSGFKVSYLLSSKTKYVGDLGNLTFYDINTFNKFQYGLTLSVGYSVWNFYVFYKLNPIFSNEVKLNGNDLNMNAINMGLIFYLL